MTPDQRSTLRRALLLTAVTGWCCWMVWPASQVAAMILLVVWVFGMAWLFDGSEP